MHVRVCPECGEEFRPEIVRCSDCGAELRDAYDEGGSRPGVGTAAVPESLEAAGVDPDVDYSPVFTTIESDAMRDAAAALARAGVTFRASGNATGYQLLVRPHDRPLAAEALGARDGAVLFGPESEAASGQEGGPCPACGTLLAAGRVECPECGLVLGEDEEP